MYAERELAPLGTIPRQLWLYELRRLLEGTGCTPRRNSPGEKAEFPALNLGLEDLPSRDNSGGFGEFEGFPALERVARERPAVEDIKAFIEVIGNLFHSYR